VPSYKPFDGATVGVLRHTKTTPVTERSEVLRKSPRRKRGDSYKLAQAVWDLFQALVEHARSGAELESLGAWWDEHKHELEQILRTRQR